jgi:hypothetical protein
VNRSKQLIDVGDLNGKVGRIQSDEVVEKISMEM